MELSSVEELILDRFHEKTRMAGGARKGYMLRKQTVCVLENDHPDLDFEQGLASLADKGLLLASESGTLFYLSEAGAEAVSARDAG
jgi:hypothetical protein